MSDVPAPPKPEIIVADDDQVTLLLYQRILGKRYKVRVCANGEDVLAEFAMRPADLVILDNNMPGMDGRQTTEALRQSELSWNVPILIVSAQDDEKHIIEGLSFGANDYLVKPLRVAELLAKIAVALRRKQLPDSALALAMGSVFGGRYQLDRVLGEGGYSKVFAARDTTQTAGNPWVALKVFDRGRVGKQSQHLAYFLREVYEHARCAHPNIVKFLDFGQTDGYHYLAMEYLEGLTLADRLDLDGELVPEADLLRIAAAVASALQCLQSHCLVHRDVKPSNIMLCPEQRIKLLDFGLAKNPSDETISLDRVFRGTPHYSSPEQILGDQPVDIRTDIYSLGATLYTAATGVPPFEADTSVAILRLHLNSTATPVAKLRPGLNALFARLIDQCLHRDPAGRPGLGDFQVVCAALGFGAGEPG